MACKHVTSPQSHVIRFRADTALFILLHRHTFSDPEQLSSVSPPSHCACSTRRWTRLRPSPSLRLSLRLHLHSLIALLFASRKIQRTTASSTYSRRSPRSTEKGLFRRCRGQVRYGLFLNALLRSPSREKDVALLASIYIASSPHLSSLPLLFLTRSTFTLSRSMAFSFPRRCSSFSCPFSCRDPHPNVVVCIASAFSLAIGLLVLFLILRYYKG